MKESKQGKAGLAEVDTRKGPDQRYTLKVDKTEVAAGLDVGWDHQGRLPRFG
jgi:hypothetical protein